MFKIILENLLKLLYNKKKYYGLLYFLYLKSMEGLEHGLKYDSVDSSGEIKVIELIKKKYANPIIIDAGANTGQYAKCCINILENKGHIYSFEPGKRAFIKLKENLNKNSNITFENIALSNKKDILKLNFDNEGSQQASIVKLDFNYLDANFSNSEEVQANSLDNYCNEKGINHISLLKLDIEGYELIALNGCENLISNNQIDMIQFEFGKPNIDSKSFIKDFYNKLESKYFMFRILSYGIVPLNKYSHEYEIFRGSNYLALHKSQKEILTEIQIL